MHQNIRKFLTGIKTNPGETIRKTIKYLFMPAVQKIGFFIELFLYGIYRFLLYPLPNRTLGRLRLAINPTVRLDYNRHAIYISAEAELRFNRAHACQKEPETINWIENNMQAGDVFYDVGANIGAYSLVASKFTHDQIQVIAFEPSFSTFDQLCRNIVKNKCQNSIQPYMIALGEETGLLTFHYHSLDGGSSEHFSDSAPEEYTHLQDNYVYQQKILSHSIDRLVSEFKFPAPNYIKLDVDGAEYSVLKGAKHTLQNEQVKSVLVEVRTGNDLEKNVLEFLTPLGFELVSRHYRGADVWNDIFVKKQ